MRNAGNPLAALAGTLIFISVLLAGSPAVAQGTDCPNPAATPSDDSMSDMNMRGSMMLMLNASTPPIPVVCLTRNDPVPPHHFAGIGSAHRPVPVPGAQPYFDDGLRFFYAFNNRESYRNFRYAAAVAGNNACAACYWGQALALGVDLNLPTQLEPDRLAALAALTQVKETATGADKLIVQALFARYANCKADEPPDQCQARRNKDYFDGMAKVEAAYPDDPDIITLYTDAAMNLTPWGYWNSDGSPVRPEIGLARQKIETALGSRRWPRHEGLIHWYIHLMEQSPWPGLTELYASQLAGLAPKAGHLVHMPSHIYYRLGDMTRAVASNAAAIGADHEYFDNPFNRLTHPDGDRYRYGYFPHNIHFLIAAAAMNGNPNNDANIYAQKLLDSAPKDAPQGFRVDKYRAVYYFARAKFSTPAQIRAFPVPSSSQPFASVSYRYAQLMADIWDRRDYTASAAAFLKAVADYRRMIGDGGKNVTCEPDQDLPHDVTLCLVTIMADLAQARVDETLRNWNSADRNSMHAVAVQDRLPYDEPPPWLYPARQQQAAILINKANVEGRETVQGRIDLATAQMLLNCSLSASTPNCTPKPMAAGVFAGNGWAYFGLVLTTKPDTPEWHKAVAEFHKHWSGGTQYANLMRM